MFFFKDLWCKIGKVKRNTLFSMKYKFLISFIIITKDVQMFNNKRNKQKTYMVWHKKGFTITHNHTPYHLIVKNLPVLIYHFFCGNLLRYKWDNALKGCGPILKFYFPLSFVESSLRNCKFKISVEVVRSFSFTQQFCLLQLLVPYSVSLIIVTITKHVFVKS